MYAGDRRELIDHHEEFIFSVAEQYENSFPELMRLWEQFYDGPRLSPAQAGAIVHELIELVSTINSPRERQLTELVLRLLPFFSYAYKENVEIKCLSD